MMLNTFPTFFDHSRHKLIVHDLKAQLDVLTFIGEETLSQPFRYTLEFTSSEQDIAADHFLGKPADFSLHTAPHLLPKVFRSLPTPEVKPLRTLHGVITSFRRELIRLLAVASAVSYSAGFCAELAEKKQP
jgi:type VI secretion system secreted protein VgrG